MDGQQASVPGPSGLMGGGHQNSLPQSARPAINHWQAMGALFKVTRARILDELLMEVAREMGILPDQIPAAQRPFIKKAAARAAVEHVVQVRNRAQERESRVERAAEHGVEFVNLRQNPLPQQSARLLPSPGLYKNSVTFPATSTQPTTGVMSSPASHGQEFGSDELDQSNASPSGNVSHPQLLNDVMASEGDPFIDGGINTPGGRGSLFQAAHSSPYAPSTPGAGSFQIQDPAFARPGSYLNSYQQVGNQSNQMPFVQRPTADFGNMNSPASLVAPSAYQDGDQKQDHATPSPTHYQGDESAGQAVDMMSPQSHFMRATSGDGDQEEDSSVAPLAQPTLDPSPLNPRVYDPSLAMNPFENSGPPKNIPEAVYRIRFHTVKLNRLHEIRKQDNVKISYNYVMQCSWLSDALSEFVAIYTGLRATSNLLESYENTRNPATLAQIARCVQGLLVPKLRQIGPNLQPLLDSATKNIVDPQYRQSCPIHVWHQFYLAFCGVKGSLLMIDRHRKDHPELYHEGLADFKFENIFAINRRLVWAWLTPRGDDRVLGEYDHFFTEQGPPADPEDLLAPLNMATVEQMT